MLCGKLVPWHAVGKKKVPWSINKLMTHWLKIKWSSLLQYLQNLWCVNVQLGKVSVVFLKLAWPGHSFGRHVPTAEHWDMLLKPFPCFFVTLVCWRGDSPVGAWRLLPLTLYFLCGRVQGSCLLRRTITVVPIFLKKKTFFFYSCPSFSPFSPSG